MREKSSYESKLMREHPNRETKIEKQIPQKGKMTKGKIKQHSAKRQNEEDKPNETRNETTLNENTRLSRKNAHSKKATTRHTKKEWSPSDGTHHDNGTNNSAQPTENGKTGHQRHIEKQQEKQHKRKPTNRKTTTCLGRRYRDHKSSGQSPNKVSH